jgi:hypothetical protein
MHRVLPFLNASAMGWLSFGAEGLQSQNLMGKILPSWGTGTHGVCGKRFAIGRLQNAVGDADD